MSSLSSSSSSSASFTKDPLSAYLADKPALITLSEVMTRSNARLAVNRMLYLNYVERYTFLVQASFPVAVNACLFSYQPCMQLYF